jgi:hypothetical protein
VNVLIFDITLNHGGYIPASRGDPFVFGFFDVRYPSACCGVFHFSEMANCPKINYLSYILEKPGMSGFLPLPGNWGRLLLSATAFFMIDTPGRP